MAAQLSLQIERRDGAGTTSAKALRRDGKVPAVIYGHGSTPESVTFERRAFDDLLHHGGGSSLITLTLGGKRFDTALVREVQIDPVSRRVIHVDLQRVSATESVHAKLRVVTVGTPEGVRSYGGVMDVLAHELEVEGPANQLPDHLEVDVSHLGIHQHVSAGEVTLPNGFRMLTPADTLVVTVEASKTERLLEEAAAGTTEQAQPELVGRPEGEGAAE